MKALASTGNAKLKKPTKERGGAKKGTGEAEAQLRLPVEEKGKA